MINKELIFKAVGLFYLTEELNNMDPHNERFSGLCVMEVDLFGLIAKMSFEEQEVYKELINHGLK